MMKRVQNEAFYCHRVWAPLIDNCLLDSFAVVRGEIGCNATRLKLELTAPHFDLGPEPSTTSSVASSESSSRVTSGAFSDAIFRDPDSLPLTALEYGASECARQFSGEFTPTDHYKLVVLLRDQLVHINRGTNGLSSVLRTIQTAGFITSGMSS